MRKKGNSSKACLLSFRVNPNPPVWLTRYTMRWPQSIFPASSFVSHKTHIAPALLTDLQLPDCSMLCLPPLTFIYAVCCFWEFLKECTNVLSSGKHVPGRVPTLCTHGALRYTSLQLSLFYGILRLHVSFPGSWELLDGTGFSTIQVFNKCLLNKGFDCQKCNVSAFPKDRRLKILSFWHNFNRGSQMLVLSVLQS